MLRGKLGGESEQSLLFGQNRSLERDYSNPRPREKPPSPEKSMGVARATHSVMGRRKHLYFSAAEGQASPGPNVRSSYDPGAEEDLEEDVSPQTKGMRERIQAAKDKSPSRRILRIHSKADEMETWQHSLAADRGALKSREQAARGVAARAPAGIGGVLNTFRKKKITIKDLGEGAAAAALDRRK